MNATFYNNKSDERYLEKNITQIGSTNIEIVDDTSIVKPIIKFRNRDIYLTANYVYLTDLRRYYFIRTVELSQGYAYMYCEEDVLYTYKDKLKQKAVVVSRQENEYNLYQVDNKTKLLNYSGIKIKEFPSGFESNKQEFIMCVVGNTTN